MQTDVVARLGDLIRGRTPVTLDEGASVAAAARLMVSSCKGALLVTKGQQLTGIFTERDMVSRVVAEGRDPEATPLTEVMTKSLVTAHPRDTHVMALRKMVTANCRHLPVVEGQRVLGMVSRRELMAVDIELLEDELNRHDPAGLFI